MSLKNYQEKIIRQLIVQEKLLAKLYGIFSKQFTQYQKFWLKLSKDEQRHSKIIEKLLEVIQKEKAHFDEKKIKTYTLNAYIVRLESIIQKAEAGEFTLSSALTTAVDYESSLIEKNVFQHFVSFSDKINNTLKILQSETQKHADQIRNALQNFKAEKGDV
ncbi:hypothetical protein MHK_000921 [Candidatus Magnetomorum sp. HK-1]|nr:hypothetical protein MHK_000921 [Candidatus Magnetomorum sp. HK-1]